MKFYLYSFFSLILSVFSFIPAQGQVKDSTLHKTFVVSDIFIDGNYKTKSSIIRRELTFHKGDTIQVSSWAQMANRSKDNLMNTSLFNFVTVDTTHLSTGQTAVSISVSERWYIWPIPIFQVEERNFNVWWDQDNRSLAKADYGFYISDNNTLGRRQILRLKAQLGYTQQYGLSYSIPYLNKNQNGGLQASFTASQNHEVAYTSVNNILTFVKVPDKPIRQEYTGVLDYTYRQGLYDTHYLEVNFHSCMIDDTLRKLTYDYLPGNQTLTNFFGAKWFFRRDLRDRTAYPLTGYYFDFSINDYGLYLLKHPFNLIYLQSTFHKYWDIASRLYYESGLGWKLSDNVPQPYYLQRSLGYSNDYIRGYEYYVIDGNNFIEVKNELKFKILNVPVQNIPLLGIRQFNKAYYALYLTAFSDWGYVGSADPYVTHSTLVNTPLWGNGFGIDLVAYYDLVWRLEYSFNKLGQSAFFLHFEAAM